jgi:hypothetical protein
VPTAEPLVAPRRRRGPRGIEVVHGSLTALGAPAHSEPVRICVLGPLEIPGSAPRLGARDRVVLAALAMRPGNPVGRTSWPTRSGVTPRRPRGARTSRTASCGCARPSGPPRSSPAMAATAWTSRPRRSTPARSSTPCRAGASSCSWASASARRTPSPRASSSGAAVRLRTSRSGSRVGSRPNASRTSAWMLRSCGSPPDWRRVTTSRC